MAELWAAAAAEARLHLRLNKCMWTEVRRTEQAPRGAASDLAELGAMAEAPPEESLKVLGAHVHLQGALRHEFERTVATAWRAFHCKKAVWRTPGSLHAKMRASSIWDCSRRWPEPVEHAIGQPRIFAR